MNILKRYFKIILLLFNGNCVKEHGSIKSMEICLQKNRAKMHPQEIGIMINIQEKLMEHWYLSKRKN